MKKKPGKNRADEELNLMLKEYGKKNEKDIS